MFTPVLHGSVQENLMQGACFVNKGGKKLAKVETTKAKFAVIINRVTLQHNKELIMFFLLLFNGFITK